MTRLFAWSLNRAVALAYAKQQLDQLRMVGDKISSRQKAFNLIQRCPFYLLDLAFLQCERLNQKVVMKQIIIIKAKLEIDR